MGRGEIKTSLMDFIVAFSVGGSVDERPAWHVLDHVLMLTFCVPTFQFSAPSDVKWDMCEKSTSLFLIMYLCGDLLMSVVPFVEEEINLAFGEGNTPAIMNFITAINNTMSFYILKLNFDIFLFKMVC
jgi:hypothetical protein